eukprot:4338193-Pyramimonas_sp.AAC.1
MIAIIVLASARIAFSTRNAAYAQVLGSGRAHDCDCSRLLSACCALVSECCSRPALAASAIANVVLPLRRQPRPSLR